MKGSPPAERFAVPRLVLYLLPSNLLRALLHGIQRDYFLQWI
jgi:hypothetical protein